jgi:hypothetical protein
MLPSTVDERGLVLLRRKLEALNYTEPLDAASASLVNHLVNDLIRTTDSYRSIKLQAAQYAQEVATFNTKVSTAAADARGNSGAQQLLDLSQQHNYTKLRCSLFPGMCLAPEVQQYCLLDSTRPAQAPCTQQLQRRCISISIVIAQVSLAEVQCFVSAQVADLSMIAALHTWATVHWTNTHQTWHQQHGTSCMPSSRLCFKHNHPTSPPAAADVLACTT